MKRLLAPLALLLAPSSALRINGWFPCAATAIDDVASVFYSNPSFECAKIELPLCHSDVCTSSVRQTEVFVKRKLATVRPAVKSVWLLEGGPGASSVNMETAMLLLYAALNETVHVYTMDHRGTGRSGFLQCEASQGLSGGSPGGENIELSELADCVRDVLFEIDGQPAAYSVTSAARDVTAVLEYLEDVAEVEEEEKHVYLYGVSYGTYLVERVMHLAPLQVKGYVVDGVLPTTSFSAVDWNKNILAPTQRFLEACYDSPDCPIQFKSKETVMEEVLTMYDEIDAAVESNACVVALSSITKDHTPSSSLRLLFNLLVRSPWWRTIVPSLLLRIHRCSEQDFADLNTAFLTIQQQLETAYGGSASASISQPWQLHWTPGRHKYLDAGHTQSMSTMLYYLITFSELWQLPMPDLESLQHDFLSGPFSLDMDTIPQYCLVSGGFNKASNDSTCKQVRDALQQGGEDLTKLPNVDHTFLYNHDQYWNKTAPLADDVSALFIVGGLDFQTPSELGKREYDALDAANKLLVEFDYGAHGSGFLPTAPEDNTLCGPRIIASFITHDGDVSRVDTSCLATLPMLKLNDQAFQDIVQETKDNLADQEQTQDQAGGP